MDEKEDLRKEIDRIDKRILEGLYERVEVAKKIGEHKKRERLAVVDVEREQAVLQRIGDRSVRLGLSREGAEAVYRDIIRLCRAAQMDETKVAFLGPRGTFCEEAARQYFQDANAVFDERPSIADVFRSVRVHEADAGVVPIENSNEGSVAATLDLLNESELKISGEMILRVTHSLITRPETKLKEIVEVASHPQALAQCRRYLEENLPHARLVEASSTAAAVSRVAESHGVAAIGTELAAQLYGLKIIASGIEDNRENHTRFFILGDKDQEPTGMDRTSILFSVKHVPGSLHEALGVLSSRKINLSKIESRPTRGSPWEYVFFCDFDGHRKDAICVEAIGELRTKTTALKVLGSYPKAR